jgi:hydrogenase-4 component F
VLWTEIIQNAARLDPSILKMAFVFVLVGFGTKAGLFPMHAWLPDAHSEAPSPVSAMLSAVLLNCALLVIFRFSTLTNLVVGGDFVRNLFLIFGSLSIVAAVFFMFVQKDIKRLLAYSSMENIGLVVLAFAFGPIGIFAGLLHALNHSLVKSLMFCTSGNILMKYRSRSLDEVKGMLQVIPGTSILMIVGALALIGTPPFNIFISKFLIIASGFGSGYIWMMLICLLLLSVAFAAFYKLMASALFGNKPEGLAKGEFNWLTLAPPAVLIILILILGLYMPPQLGTLLQRATGVVSGIQAGPVTSLNLWQNATGLSGLKEFFSPIASLLP